MTNKEPNYEEAFDEFYGTNRILTTIQTPSLIILRVRTKQQQTTKTEKDIYRSCVKTSRKTLQMTIRSLRRY